MSTKGNQARKKYRFRGPSKADTYTVWVGVNLRGSKAERGGAVRRVKKALMGGKARSTGRKWLTQPSTASGTADLAVFIPGCSAAKARAQRVASALKAAGLTGKVKVFHEALYSTKSVKKCPRR